MDQEDLVTAHEPWFLEWCEECQAWELVIDAGSGPGFCTSMWWVTFSCGHSVVEGDHIEA